MVDMIDLVSAIETKKTEDIKQYPIYNNIASELGHPCLRYLVYCRTNWKDRPIPSLEKLLIFEEGKLHEWKVIKDLHDAGIRVWSQGFYFGDEDFFKKHLISGKIDGAIEVNNEKYPLEIKSMKSYTFESINTIEDMMNSKIFWLKKYPAQISIYMLGCNVERGIFILKNKTNGKLKQLNVNLDYNYAESLIKKADLINEYIEKKQLPEQINNDDICSECDFAHICMPDKNYGKIEIFDMVEVKHILDKREELLKYKKELDEIEEQLKQFDGKPDIIICGKYRITGQWVERKEYTVPAGKYWKRKIEILGKDKE